MIMARNEDGTYSQVGFVKDNAGIDTEYIYDKDGDIVFEKGFTRETSGTVPLTINGIGKDLKAWSITGNTVQNGTPTPDTPQEVKAVGDKTANLLNFEDLIAAPSGLMPDGRFTFPHLLTLYLKPNTTYTCASSGTGSITSTQSDLNRSIYFCITDGQGSVNVNNPVTYTTDSTGRVFIGFIDSRANAQQYLNKTAYIWLNEGSTPLPYEPYGYKIPVVTRGKNLLKLKEVNLTIQGVAVSIKNDSITVKGTAKASDGRTTYLSESFVLQPGTYFISGNVVNGLVYCLTDKSNGKAVIASSSSKFELAEKTEVGFGLNVINGVSYDATVNVMLNEGNKILPYEPYHEPITTPIYLPTPLYSSEVMRSDGTITRSDGTTETFTAPQIPTLNGTTVIDVDTAVKPTKMYIKYKSSK